MPACILISWAGSWSCSRVPGTTPNGAQLIFNTNDTSILGDSGRAVLGRDQVWFTEKAPDGASSLYALADFSPSPRRDDPSSAAI